MSRIVLSHDARTAWLESMPELQTAFKHEGELNEFVMRAALAGHQLVAEGTDVVAQLAIARRA